MVTKSQRKQYYEFRIVDVSSQLVGVTQEKEIMNQRNAYQDGVLLLFWIDTVDYVITQRNGGIASNRMIGSEGAECERPSVATES